jgi:hypothetical protein
MGTQQDWRNMKSNKLWIGLSFLIIIVGGLYYFADLSRGTTDVNKGTTTLISTNIPATPTATATLTIEDGPVTEQAVFLIPLDGPIAKKSAELSGLAWYGDTLILLPQYPERFGEDGGMLFAIPKQMIMDYLDGKSNTPITPTTIKMIAPGLSDSIHDFGGYEAIAFSGRNIYLTIEAGKNEKMMGYLVTGNISADQSEIRIDTTRIVKIPPPLLMDNRAYEALIVDEDRILAFFEVNGKNLNPSPIAHVFALDLSPLGTIPFPNLEYRVTDAARDSNGQIWVINKFSPNDEDITTRIDPLVEQYGQGTTHQEYGQVERLVALGETSTRITLMDKAPIQLKLFEDVRNWEGLVALDKRGFLLVTDKSPGTLLGFVPLP